MNAVGPEFRAFSQSSGFGDARTARVTEPETRKVITPETLLADNQSEASHKLRRIWEIARAHKQLTLESDCVEPRVYPTLKVAQLRTVANGANGETYEAFEGLINDESIQRIAIVTHRDKETDKKGVSPEGCGGLHVKKKQKANEAPTKGGAHAFVHEKVYHEDPIIQAVVSAYRISHWTTKPVLAAIRDHLSQEILPLAIFQRGEGQEFPDIYSHPNVNVAAILAGEYQPEKMYKTDEVPHLDVIDPRLDAFYTYFLDNKNDVIELARRHKNLRDKMKVPDADAIAISTQTRPLRTIHLETFGDPGTAFEVTAARCGKNVSSAARRISEEAVEEIVQQAAYAMGRALDPKDKGFRKTRTILIETPRMAESKEIAQAIAETELGANWLAEGRKIIVAEIRSGKIVDHQIEYFQPAA